MKLCIKCGARKTMADFRPARQNKDGRRGACRLCLRDQQSEYQRTVRGRELRKVVARRQMYRPRQRWHQSRSSSKLRGLTFTICFDDFARMQQLPCHYCGAQARELLGSGLDRLDNGRGYELDNVVPCCGVCNAVRSNTFTPDEMSVIGRAIAEVRSERQRDGQEPLVAWTAAARRK